MSTMIWGLEVYGQQALDAGDVAKIETHKQRVQGLLLHSFRHAAESPFSNSSLSPLTNP